MDTSGFYKKHEGIILHGPNYVSGNGYELGKDYTDRSTLPIDGWYWFDDVKDAENSFGIPFEQPIPEEMLKTPGNIPDIT